MTRRATHALVWTTVLTLVTTLVTAAVLRAQNDAADAEHLVRALAIDPGDTVAEIGAGRGALTLAIARTVGLGGRLYTTELVGNVDTLRRAVEQSGLTQISVVNGHPSQTNLPDECCDAIFMRDVYHHFADPAVMNVSLFRSLKPGGHLGILDFPPEGGSAGGRESRGEGNRHGVSRDTVSAELKQAGFDVVSVEDARGRNFLVVARRPASR
jgi:ubiquinone/menaquinone biosynthesis C-methylase UbiE